MYSQTLGCTDEMANQENGGRRGMVPSAALVPTIYGLLSSLFC